MAHISVAQLRTGKNACLLSRMPSLDDAMSQIEFTTANVGEIGPLKTVMVELVESHL